MFVRWKRRKPQIGKKAHAWRRIQAEKRGEALSCELVTSNRLNGFVRQKVILYLGSIWQGEITDESPRYRYWFWARALDQLDAAELAPELKQKIEDKIAET